VYCWGEECTKLLLTGKEYTVDAKAGVVYLGLVEEVLKPAGAVCPADSNCYSCNFYENLR